MLNPISINQFLLQICLAWSRLKKARMFNTLAFFRFPRLRAFLPKSVSRIALIFFLFSISAQADELQKYNLQRVGKADFSMLFWDVYDIELFAESEQYSPDKIFALKLTYKMDFTGADIAERSVKEMRTQGAATEEKLAEWGKLMTKIFPDVKNGSSLTGVRNGLGETIFIHDGKEIAHVKDVDFTKAFFGIWLSEKTTEPTLRKQLLAGK